MNIKNSLSALVLAIGLSSASVAQQIDLLLDIRYDGQTAVSGGEWRLLVKTDGFGLFSLNVPIAGISSSVTPQLPKGRVNGSETDNAGFSVFQSTSQSGYEELFIAQQFVTVGTGQQGVFYGVGTLSNGSPDYPGQPGGTNSIGPNITSLTNVTGVPWGNESVLSGGAVVANGLFSAGSIPSFADAPGSFEGRVFTSLGDINVPGSWFEAESISMSVIDDLTFGVATGDYNQDGLVDAADYTVYRDSLGESVTPLTGADGDGDGVIDQGDYNVWAANYGRSESSAVAVPEPAGLFLTLAGLIRWGRNRKQMRLAA